MGRVRAKVLSSPWASLPSSPEEPVGQRSLGLYFERTAAALGGFFDVDFWCRLLPRVATTEEPIRYALIAISTLHEEKFGANERSFTARPQSSLTHYNEAIRSLNQRVSTEGDHQRVILLTCILFICMEFMRGTPEIGLDHLQNGLNILVSDRADPNLPM